MEIVVTDLTKFHNKDIVCLAGLNPVNCECIRPLPYLKCADCVDKQILPGVKLQGTYSQEQGKFPHCEDRDCTLQTISGKYNYDDFCELLNETLSHSISSGFGVELKDGQKHISCDSPPNRSIVTVLLNIKRFEMVGDSYNPGRIKATFTDNDGNEFKYISITDYCYCEYAEKNKDEFFALHQIGSFLNSQEKVYLRVGLTRPYTSPDGRAGYWIQINGIYPYPKFCPNIRNVFD